MKRIIACLFGLALLPALGFAAPQIGVVFNGNSEVNRETFLFLRKTVAMTGYDYQFTVLSPSANADAGLAGVIVLNTGLSSGTDPVLAGFIKRTKGKLPLVLVSLYQGKSAVSVEITPAAKQELGVDAIASASLWGGRGMRGERPNGPPPAAPAGNPPAGRGQGSPESAHLAWFSAALKLLSAGKA